MNPIGQFEKFTAHHGIPLSGINPGSSEYALDRTRAIDAINILNDTDVAVLGGDVLRMGAERLEYVLDNWHFPSFKEKIDNALAGKSRDFARSYIEKYDSRGKCVPLFVLVVKRTG
ncbi:MAG: Imm40 family immunity protein [Xanthobacteraceae bacterium]|jgi:hypothetical protein